MVHGDIKQNKTIGRLKKRADFLRLNQTQTKWITPSFVLQVDKSASENKQNFGVTVTKKTAPKAISRNRIKRRLRHLASQYLPELAKDSCDYVFIGREAALELGFQQMAKDLKWALKRLECLADQS